MRIDSIVQQTQEKRIPNHHVTRNNDRNRELRTHTHRIPRYNAPRCTKRHYSDQWQEDSWRQRSIVGDTPFCQHNHARAAQHHAPHQPNPPQHVRQDREPEAPRRRASERDLSHKCQIRDRRRALVRNFLDLVERLGLDVAREGDEAHDGEQREGGEEHEVEDKHYRAEYAQAVKLPRQDVHDD